MARLLVQFFSDELAEFRWASIDEAVQNADINWQQAGEDELATIAAQHPHPLILIIPQQCMYMTQVELLLAPACAQRRAILVSKVRLPLWLLAPTSPAASYARMNQWAMPFAP